MFADLVDDTKDTRPVSRDNRGIMSVIGMHARILITNLKPYFFVCVRIKEYITMQ